MSTKMVVVVYCVGLFLLLMELIRRDRLTFKYASPWIICLLLGIFFGVFDQFLDRVSAWLGFGLTSNFIFFAVLGGFVFLSLLMTLFLCQQNKRNDRIAQQLGILEHELRELKKQNKSSSS